MSRINRRAFLKASGGAATIGVLAGCSGDGGDGGGDGGGGDGGDGGDGGGGDGGDGGGSTGGGDGGSSEPIVIGALEPLSGPFAPWSTVHRDGLQYAVDEVNADGGVLGRELAVEITDTGADPGQADSSFRRLVEQDDAVVTTGAVSSDVGLRVAQTAAELEVPHFLHMSGTDDVITPETQYIFRVGLLPASRSVQAQATAFGDAGYEQVGAIVADYAWGRSVEDAINEYYDVDVNIQVAPFDTDDFGSYLRQFPDDLEYLMTTGHPAQAVTIANQAFELGFSPDVITGANIPPQLLAGALSDDAIEVFAHIHQSDPFSDAFQEAAEGFAGEYEEQFNTHTAFGYATGQMIAAAIEEAGEADPTAIADATRNITLDTVLAAPLQYSDVGELDQAVAAYSRILHETPPYDSEGTYSYEELHRSDPVPAREP